MKVTNTKPPIEIYDVLHAAEAAGVEIPERIDKWWADETATNETLKSIHEKIKKMVVIGRDHPDQFVYY